MAYTKQFRVIFGMAKAAGIDEATLRDILFTRFKKNSFTMLSVKDANDFIDLLVKLHPSLKRKIKKQYPGNLVRLATSEQIKYILQFAEKMNWTESSVNLLASKMFPGFVEKCKDNDAQFSFRALTVSKVQAIIEAMKDIQERKISRGHS